MQRLRKEMNKKRDAYFDAIEQGIPEDNKAFFIKKYVLPYANARQDLLNYQLRLIVVKVDEEGVITGDT